MEEEEDKVDLKGNSTTFVLGSTTAYVIVI